MRGSATGFIETVRDLTGIGLDFVISAGSARVVVGGMLVLGIEIFG